MVRLRCILIAATLTVLPGCARSPVPVMAAAPPPPVSMLVPMPAGTYRGMPVPALLADGEYATPNAALSPAASIWHLRTGLNFAALACRGAEEGAIVAGYNSMLALHRPGLAAAERALSAEYRSAGGAAWRDGYDDAMTRLYNYWSLSAARPALCAAAARLVDEARSVPAESFAAFAAARLPVLDHAVTDVYRAYDAWRMQASQPTYAVAANVAMTPVRQAPWIEVDPAVLRMP